MKTTNANQPGERTHGVVRGHIGILRAGSPGISLTDSTTTVDGVTSLEAIGATLYDTGDGTAQLLVELGLGTLTAITPAQLVANTDDWAPVDATTSAALSTATIVRASTDASRNLTGIVAPSPAVSRMVILENVGAFNLVLKHNVTSTAANRFYCPNDADLTLQKDATAILLYDTTTARWRAVGGSGGSVATDTIWDAAGDLAVGTGADTAAKLAITVPAANILNVLGVVNGETTWSVKSVHDGTVPATQAFGDAAAAGTALTAAHRDHVHAMPTAAVTTSGLTQTTARLLGRTTAATGAIEEITVGTGLSLASGSLTLTGTSGPSAIAYSSGDVTVTSSLADITGCTLSLAAGTYIIAATFDTLVNNALNDRVFEGHLDSGGVDQTNYGILTALALVNDRVPVTQLWRLVLAATTTVKLRGKYSGGTAGDFTVKAQSSIAAWGAYTVTALPTIRAVGASASGTGAIVPGLPAGHTTNDILLLFVQSDNETITAPAGYKQLGPMVGIGTAAAASATRLGIFWKRDGGAETDPTVADTGDHTLAQIMAVTGCVTTGDPFISVGQTRKTTASVTGTAIAGATHVDNCLVVAAFAHALDSATAVFSSWTNASLGSVTEQIDVATADGNGGGIGVATGTLAVAGPFVATTVTETSTVDVSSTFYMIPSGANTARAIDRQLFTTAGFADTWTGPTGAKTIYVAAIGSGASGSGGRNAATAAGGGGGGGGGWRQDLLIAASLPATLTVTAGAGGAATANSDGAASNVGALSSVLAGASRIFFATGGAAAGASASNSGGLGGNGGGLGTATAAGISAYGGQPPGGGTGGTTAGTGGSGLDFNGGAGAGGGTSQAASTGGDGERGAGGGGGGRSNTNVGTGGGGGRDQNAGGQTAGAAGTSSTYPERGGGGGAGGTSAAGPGGAGGWPGGGGGGGGSQSGAQRGGAGGDGVVVIVTYC